MHDTITMRRPLRAVILTFFVSAGAIACDVEDRSDDQARIVHCNLTDRECAAMPELAEAIEVVRSMGIDPDQETVELWVREDSDLAEDGSSAQQSLPESRGDVDADESPADATLSPEDSLSAPVDVQEQPGMACAGEWGGCRCCCWAGFRGEWGCDCFSCW